MTELEVIAKQIKKAKSYIDIFGNLDTIVGADKHKAINKIYNQLIIIIHPDHYQASPKMLVIAEAALKKLIELKNEAEGNTSTKSSLNSTTITSPIIVEVRKQRFTINKHLFRGDICDLYDCSIDTIPGHFLFKIVQHPSDNDLIQNEARVYSEIYPKTAKDEKFYRFLIRPADTFSLKSKTSNRAAIVLPYAEGYISLAQIIKAYPDGIDFRDMVWMFKRTLSALGFIHRQNVVHGAITPDHILIHPKDHGAKIIDWCYAVKPNDKIKAISAAHRGLYAPEILAKKPATPATDIYMAANCALTLLGKDINKVPPRVISFLRGCLIAAPLRRPDDAWALHDEFDELLERVVGKRTYREFHMPKSETV